MILWEQTQFQIRRRAWSLIVMAILSSLSMLGMAARLEAETTGSKAPPVQPPQPPAQQWQPDELQRAMGLGTTMPNDVPLPIIPLEPLKAAEEAPPLLEEIPPIFRKPLPITSPAKPPVTQPQ